VTSVLVVGSGLIGTSIGLALRDQRRVLLTDTDPNRVATARGRGAGEQWDGTTPADLVVFAVPPRAVAPELGRLAAAGIGTTYTHVASIQSQVQADLEAAEAPVDQVCGGHPLAGRETAGPESATAELFLGRPWVLCPSERTSERAQDDVRRLALDCGAEPTVLSPADHDRTVALVSHLPQVAASAVAALLLSAPSAVDVSGPGLQDTTRVAASDPSLWVEVLLGNAAYVAPLVRELARDLDRLAEALQSAGSPLVRDLLERGNRGRALVPVKRGEHDRDFTTVAVGVPDKPGQLAGLFVTAAEAGVNVEDVRVEHLPGRPTGVIELMAHPDDRERLVTALAAAGFAVLRGD
jgi:prephenate dehydrogenase